MKHAIGSLLCASLLLAGCGKKKEVKVENPVYESDMMASSQYENPYMMDESSDQYVYDDTLPELEELAFIDENQNPQEGQEEYLEFASNADMSDFAENQNYALTWEDQEKKSDFEALRFVFDSEKLVAGQEKTLQKNIESAKKAVEEGNKVALYAYADPIGTEDYNLALTQRRANAMKKVCINAGIPESEIEAVGRGQTCQLVDSKATDRLQRIEELAVNRRVEMQVLSQDNIAA